MPEYQELVPVPRKPEAVSKEEWDRIKAIGTVTVAKVTVREILKTPNCCYMVKPVENRVVVEHQGPISLEDMGNDELKIMAARLGKPIMKKQIARTALIEHVRGLLEATEVTEDEIVEAAAE